MDLYAVLGEIRAPGIKKRLFLLLVLLFPPLLYLFQSFVFGGMLSRDVVFRYFILDYTQPNMRSMFFANYTHNPLDPWHFNTNIISFIIIGLLIWFFYYHVIPASVALVPKNFLTVNIALFFLAFPFAISGLALFFQRIGSLSEGIRYGIGFSGIVWAFTGMLLFLMIFVMFMEFFSGRIITGSAGLQSIRRTICLILLFIAFAVMSLFFLILADIGTDSNPFAHFAGFALGFIIPPLVVLLLDAKSPLRRAYPVLGMGFILGLASGVWIFI